MVQIAIMNAGNCVLCGQKMKIVVKRGNDKLPNIFFCSKCERIVNEKKEWRE
jgi:hypothetical protein